MWKEIKHTIGTNGRVEKYIYEYIINFPPSQWNKKETSPIIKIRLNDYKTETGWWLDKEKTKWYTQPPNKVCHIEFGYFQRQTDLTISTFSDETPDYEDFTLEFCKEYALRIFKRRVNNVLKQINIIDTIV